MINVLIADNSPIFRRGLKHIAEETPDIAITAEASNRDELLEKARADGCNIAVIDLAIPGVDGPRFLKELQQEHPGLPVLVLSDHPEDEYALRALRAGASGYITKESSSDQLVGAIRTVTQGGEYLSEALAKLASELDAHPDVAPHKNLSDREFQVFSMIASGMTVTEVADELELNVKTVSTYRARILKKMNMDRNSELTSYAVEHGLLPPVHARLSRNVRVGQQHRLIYIRDPASEA